MTHTAKVQALSPAASRAYAWLLHAADLLDKRGDTFDIFLAIEARAEAAALLTPAPAPTEPVHKCDACGRVIRSTKRIEAYEALGVDWVQCKACERQRVAAWARSFHNGT